MAIELTQSALVSGGHGGGGGIGNLLLIGGVAGGAYFGYRWWQQEQIRAALMAEAARLQAGGMGLRDALTNAAAGGCVAAAAGVLKMPPATAAPMCMGAAVVAMKAAELTLKGGKIAAKVIGKGAVVVGKGIGKGAVAVGKGAKAVTYTAPKKVIGGVVNTSDRLLTKGVNVIVPKAVQKIIPKPVKQVLALQKKIVKKVLCLGIFCGLDGIDGIGVYDQALAGPGPSPRRRISSVGARHPITGNPIRPRPVSRAGRSGVGRAAGARPAAAAYYESFFRG